MSLQNLRLLEDEHLARTWSPFAETGCVGRLLFGSMTLRTRLVLWSGLSESEDGDAAKEGTTLWISPRFVPADHRIPAEILNWKASWGSRQVVTPEGNPIGWLTPAGVDRPSAESGFTSPSESSTPLEAKGALLHSPWDLMDQNGDQLTRDLMELGPSAGAGNRRVRRLAAGHAIGGFWVLGDAPVTLEPGAKIGPQVVLDASDGPIHISAGAEISPLTHLSGPAWIGPDARILGGRLSSVTIGPVSRIRGEVEASVIQGWTNKAHDGFIGHAVVGSWVNLGALTTNSDLKNTYGTVRVYRDARTEEDTGMQKVGVLLGDHVKTGIGTLLTTGTVVGAGSNVLGGGPMPPRWVPPFSWFNAGSIVPVRWEAFVTVAERTMARRSQTLSLQDQEQLRRLWVETHHPTDPSMP